MRDETRVRANLRREDGETTGSEDDEKVGTCG